jgi:hypothetical protein
VNVDETVPGRASETPFGQRVTFIPNGRTARWLGEESAVLQELRALVARTSNQPPAG